VAQSKSTQAWLRGERYIARAPDTLDLSDRMSLAINALTNVWYPEERWGQGFLVDFSQRPPVIFPSHITDAYLNIPPKFIEALVCCRTGSGSDRNLDVDDHIIATQLSLLGEDGLTYCPYDTFKDFSEKRGFSEIWGEGRMLSALSMLYQVDNDPGWVEIGCRKVDRLLALSKLKEDFRFFWKGRFYLKENPPDVVEEPSVPISGGSLADYDPLFSKVYSIGALGHGSGLFYRVTGYEPALELSRGLARWGLKRIFTNTNGRYDFWHFHHGLYSLMAVWEYALAADDTEIMQQVNACYQWARQMGDAKIGYFPELFPDQKSWQYLNWNGKTVEICEVADIIWLALNLTRAGIGDYWDDVDCWVRNVFTNGQICNLEDFDRIPEDFYDTNPSKRPHQNAENILERSLGAFLGWMRPNDGLKVVKTQQGMKLANLGIQHCCTANGARTLFHVWDSILTRQGNQVKVNLLLNRASPYLEVDSYLPVEGRIVLKVRDAISASVRVPFWVLCKDLVLTINGKERIPEFQERYVQIADLNPGDEVEVKFPMPEQTITRVIGDLPFTLSLRGSNVVNIDPPGIALPLYRNLSTGQLVDKRRFLPENIPAIW
jgi:hypothetical protein